MGIFTLAMPRQAPSIVFLPTYVNLLLLRVQSTLHRLLVYSLVKRVMPEVLARVCTQERGGAGMQAMFVDYGMAAQYGGDCFLRFDDTNPEAEKQEYIDHIKDIVAWMGWTPHKVWINAVLL